MSDREKSSYERRNDSMSPASPSQADVNHAPSIVSRTDLAKVSLGALGIVYGDIGTSPLYAVQECFGKEYGLAVTQANVIGIVSLIFWSLVMVVIVKYLTFIMRADNHGEGGILALLALLKTKGEKPRGMVMVYVLLGLFGAALLYGDGIITPGVSVLGAVEGLGQANQGGTLFTKPVIVTISVVILLGLFAAQKRGTSGVGTVFGPTMLIWFLVIAFLGVKWIIRRPDVLQGVDPRWAIRFFFAHGIHGFLVLGAVVLCITGGEALYADMGHFGKKPIRVAWFVVVFPALIANYFGQAAVLLEKGPVEKPFYEMVDGFWRYPLTAIATAAAIVASQALISGAFSLTQSAVQLGYWPRVTIKHTSGRAEGQIYIPEVNRALMVGCIALVLWWQEASKFAAAYGIAVTGTMSITSILFYGVARRWGWHPLAAGALVALFLVFDLAFFGANIHKVAEGGWFPLAVGVLIFTAMTTWFRGRARLYEAIKAATLPMKLFLEDIAMTKPHRVQGTAIFMTSNPEGAPPAMLHHFKHNKVLHKHVVLLAIHTKHIPEVPDSERIAKTAELGEGLWQVIATYGFMQTPNVLEVLDRARAAGVPIDEKDTSFFLGRETLLLTDSKGMARWRKAVFSYMSRNARPANAFFQIPPNRVVELGTHIEL